MHLLTVLFLSIFSGYGVVNLVFNPEEVRNRNQVSPLSTRRLNRVVSIGMLGYSLLLTSCFTAGDYSYLLVARGPS